MRKLLIKFIFFSLSLFLIQGNLTSLVHAFEMYQYIDEYGVEHFSDVPTDPRFKPQIIPRIPNFPPPHYGYFEFHNIIHSVALQQGMDPLLIRAVIKTESDFNPYAVSKKGAQGLMQLMPPTALSLSVNNSFDPGENIRGGVRYLKYLLKRFNNNLILALAAYNAGETSVLKYKKVPPFKETRNYIAHVIQRYKLYLLEENRQPSQWIIIPKGTFY